MHRAIARAVPTGLICACFLCCNREARVETLSGATGRTLTLVWGSKNVCVKTLVDRVHMNDVILSNADHADPFFDDLAVATFAASSLLVVDKGLSKLMDSETSSIRPGSVIRRAEGMKTAFYVVLGERNTPITGLDTAPCADDLSRTDKQVAEESFLRALSRLAGLHELKLEKHGPFAGALADFGRELKAFKAELLQGFGDGSEAQLVVELTAYMGSLERTVLLQAMNLHLRHLIDRGRWDDFKERYPLWVANPATGKIAATYENVAVKRLGLKEAASLGCFRACDDEVEQLRRALELKPSKDAEPVVRRILREPGVASRYRAIRQMLSSEDERLVLAVLADAAACEAWKRAFVHFKEELRSLFERWRDTENGDMLWRAWDRMWGDAAQELGKPKWMKPQILTLPSGETITITVEGGGDVRLEVESAENGE